MSIFYKILQSKKDDSLYIGFSAYLKQRIKQHNLHLSKYSASKAPFVLVWYCAFQSKFKAIEFEKYLKSGSGFAFSRKRFI